MRVAFISYEYGYGRLFGEKMPFMYGCGRYTTNLVKNLRKLGVDIDVFTVNNHIKNIGVPWFMLKNGLKNFNKYDILHSNEFGGAFVRHPKKIETVNNDYSARSYTFLGSKYLPFLFLARSSIRGAKHIIVGSDVTKRGIRNMDSNISEERISVIHLGVDKQVFNNSKANKKLAALFRVTHGLTDYFVVINVGRLVRQKNQKDVIKAIADLKRSALILVGQGSEKSSLINLARRKKVRLLHFDYVSDAKLAVLYNASDVYVHTAMVEGFGLTVLEAMACGLPIIAYDTADFEYMVGDGGYLFKKEDILGIRSAVRFLKENERERKKLGRKAEKRSNLFTWDKSAKAHLKIYEEICYD